MEQLGERMCRGNDDVGRAGSQDTRRASLVGRGDDAQPALSGRAGELRRNGRGCLAVACNDQELGSRALRVDAIEKGLRDGGACLPVLRQYMEVILPARNAATVLFAFHRVLVDKAEKSIVPSSPGRYRSISLSRVCLPTCAAAVEIGSPCSGAAVVKIPIQVEPASETSQAVEYRWDPDTEILSAQLSPRVP